VPVLPGDDADGLAARVLSAEHRLYPACLAAAISGAASAPEAGAILSNPALS
jgi:folate-dependent phosphoribosylglycinamide formyltransferase PurN